MPSSATEGQRHRGRLQVQGGDLTAELSFSWADPEALKASVALDQLQRLKEQLSKRQLERRRYAFQAACLWIKKKAERGGVGRVTKTFPEPRRRSSDYPDARVDIDVITGRAFVP